MKSPRQFGFKKREESKNKSSETHISPIKNQGEGEGVSKIRVGVKKFWKKISLQNYKNIDSGQKSCKIFFFSKL